MGGLLSSAGSACCSFGTFAGLAAMRFPARTAPTPVLSAEVSPRAADPCAVSVTFRFDACGIRAFVAVDTRFVGLRCDFGTIGLTVTLLFVSLSVS